MSNNSTFVYVTYITTTPERLWQALTEPAFTERYWGARLESDWRKGSPITWVENGWRATDDAQQVLEAEPGRRLAYTWHTITPEWATAMGLDDDVRDTLAAEGRSKVTFDLEQIEERVKLTVVHEAPEPDSTLISMVSNGWPELLSSLKTLLEAPEQVR